MIEPGRRISFVLFMPCKLQLSVKFQRMNWRNNWYRYFSLLISVYWKTWQAFFVFILIFKKLLLLFSFFLNLHQSSGFHPSYWCTMLAPSVQWIPSQLMYNAGSEQDTAFTGRPLIVPLLPQCMLYWMLYLPPILQHALVVALNPTFIWR